MPFKVMISLNVPFSFHARAVVAEDVNDGRIFAEAHLFNRLQDPPDSVVGVLLVTGIDFHLTRIQFLFCRRHPVPRGEGRSSRCQFVVGRNDAKLAILCDGLLALLVLTLIDIDRL